MTNLNQTARSSEFPASGNRAATSALRLSFTSHNLREWAPLLEGVYGSPYLPFAVHGWASFTGNASGKLSALSVSGNLEVYDFDTVLPATERGAARAVHWDALSTAIQYSSSHFPPHNDSFIHAHTTARFDASATLTDGRLPVS